MPPVPFYNMNETFLHELVRGKYGRKVAYANTDIITEENVVRIVGETIGIFNRNKAVVKYLWDYKNGDQPILYREKTIRDDVINYVVENHAWEIVAFKNGQTYGEPIQFVSLKKDESVNNYVDKLNDYCRGANKATRDVTSGEWTSAVGTGFKAIQRKDGDVPFRIVIPTPMNTYIIYSKYTEEPLLSVQELTDTDNKRYYLCFSETHEYRIKDSRLTGYTRDDGTVEYSRLHGFGGIPIVEYPNNQDRISDIELVITLLDSINNMQSNRMDAVEQFVQAWVKFVNCDIDEETFRKMKMEGALVVKSNNGDNKADVDVIATELSQSESQVAKNDLWDNALQILGIPSRQENTGGDTQGAVQLRNGWDVARQRAKLKDPYIAEGDKRLADVILNVIRQNKGNKECPLKTHDYDVQISHSPLDNLYVKVESLQLLLNAGIHPLVAIQTSGLWADSEKTYNLSKPFLDVLYKTIDTVMDEETRKAQETAAQTVLEQARQERAERVEDNEQNRNDEILLNR